ncbi:ABC transporter ATP-binding protein [Elizabethkingia meningoseptica]|uniref:ABC transporter ATP-binding protein n=1 Tax=Elizabethkingia meningoseptica TaxID=238 RepID=UPI000B354C02|nr:ABC transporter ATP-binding protein [Elizabethkingia meningoseptica]
MMKQQHSIFEEIRELILFKDLDRAVKRIIDLTLDTENLQFYKETNTLLDWLDTKPAEEAVVEKLNILLQKLKEALSTKKVIEQNTIISVKGLSKKYGMGFALGPIDLDIKSGEIIGLVGENGNGKTTLLRSLCEDLQPTSGHIKYNFPYKDGYDLRTKLVYIPQRTDTWRGSMYENLIFTAASYGYTPEENRAVVDLVITRLGLRPFRKHSWNSLSSGYKMRFELARMLLRKPQILLIDEPLANLDILAQQTILDDFRNIAVSPYRPIAIVLSSQQLYEVEKASQQVVFLKNGAQRNLKSQEAEEIQFIIEFETDDTLSNLKEKLSTISLVSIEQNGGTFVAHFPMHITVQRFLETALKENIQLVYFRNITHSTRRFFVK